MTSDEQDAQGTNGHTNLDFVKALFKGEHRKSQWMRMLYILAAFSGGSTALTTICALGQIVAHDFLTAFKAFWPYWIAGPFYGPLLFVSVLLLVIGAEIASALGDKVKARFPTLKKILSALTLIFPILITCAYLFLLGLASASKKSKSPDVKPEDIPSIAKVANQQQESVDNLSSSAKSMLVSLTATENEIDTAKQHLQVTVLDLAKQEQDAAQANQRVQELSQEEEDINDLIAKAKNTLGDKYIITRSDLKESEWEGEWHGAIVGILIALLGAYIFELFKRRILPKWARE